MKTLFHSPLIICHLALFLFFSSQINAQVTFEKMYPASYDQTSRDVLPTTDGGYILAGMTMNAIPGDSDVFILKTDGNGNVLWTKTYGGPKPDFAHNILIAADGNYFVTGFTKSFSKGHSSTWLLKINSSNGDTIWTKTYGGPGYDEGHEIIPTSDGNYIIAGSSNSQDTTNYNGYLMKVDPSGNVIWTKYYGGPQFETANSVKQTPDGGYILCGQTFSFGNPSGDVWLVRTDVGGNAVWAKAYGGTSYQEGNSVLANNDGTYIILGETNRIGAGNIDVWVVATDSSGTMTWNKTYGGPRKDVSHRIIPTIDGGYAIAAITRSYGLVNPDMWLIKINQVGDTAWTQHYGNQAGHQHCYSVRQTSDGGYVIVGHSDCCSSNTEIYFLKLNPLGELGPLSNGPTLVAEEQLTIRPNPADGIMELHFQKLALPSSLFIYDMTGQEVFYKELPIATEKIMIDLTGNERGVYFVSLQCDKKLIIKKIVLE